MRRTTAAFAAGLIFGVGLAVSEMINPAKLLAFLDVAGDWDPRLALVLAGALGVSAMAFRLVARRPGPMFASAFQLPTRKDIDAPLIAGSALFGVVWGLVGLCPCPALALLGLGRWEPTAFVLAMIGGMLLYDAMPSGSSAARPQPPG